MFSYFCLWSVFFRINRGAANGSVSVGRGLSTPAIGFRQYSFRRYGLHRQAVSVHREAVSVSAEVSAVGRSWTKSTHENGREEESVSEVRHEIDPRNYCSLEVTQSHGSHKMLLFNRQTTIFPNPPPPKILLPQGLIIIVTFNRRNNNFIVKLTPLHTATNAAEDSGGWLDSVPLCIFQHSLDV